MAMTFGDLRTEPAMTPAQMCKRWRASNPDKVKASNDARDPEMLRRMAREYGKSEVGMAKRTAYRLANPDKWGKRETRHARSVRQRLEILSHYSPLLQCQCCGETEYSFLHLDHINNDGAKQRRELAKELGSKQCSNEQLFAWIKLNDFPKTFQVLCANCNLGKQHNHKGRECPHQTRQRDYVGFLEELVAWR